MHKYNRAIVAHIGPMFGGKTSGLLADVRKMRIAGYKVALFKPAKDQRYSNNKIVNHDGESIEAINIVCYQDIMDYIKEHPEVNVIAIDEFQFIKSFKEFPDNPSKNFKTAMQYIQHYRKHYIHIEDFIKWIMNNKKTLIISALDLDSELKPFDKVKSLLPFATHIYKHKAVCSSCGNDATTSYCKVDKDSQEQIGGKDMYEPLCLNCYLERKSLV